MLNQNDFSKYNGILSKLIVIFSLIFDLYSRVLIVSKVKLP